MNGRSGLWPVRVAPVGLVAVGSTLWRHRRQLWCTVIVKATFQLPESGPMTRINPQQIRRADESLSGRPSLAGAAETAPKLPGANVVLVGHAHAPKGGVTKLAVRLNVVHGHEMLVDKMLWVYGDRQKGGKPKAFGRMPLGWERALGGLDLPDNPIGVGAGADADHLPNIVDPQTPARKIAGYGPIPARFPRRRRLRGEVPLDRIEGGIADYPDDFNWDYFHVAAKDQRIKRLKGDEWILVENMHPRWPRIRARLPRARAYARVFQRRPVGAPELVNLVADTLHIEPDEERCSLIWRGNFPLSSELAAAELVLIGAVQCGDERVPWPATVAEVESIATEAADPTELPGSKADDLQTTAVSGKHVAQRSLGAGVRLGEQARLAAPPVHKRSDPAFPAVEPQWPAPVAPPPSSTGWEPPPGGYSGWTDPSTPGMQAPVMSDPLPPPRVIHPFESTMKLADVPEPAQEPWAAKQEQEPDEGAVLREGKTDPMAPEPEETDEPEEIEVEEIDPEDLVETADKRPHGR
jgi:hypothetical protein